MSKKMSQSGASVPPDVSTSSRALQWDDETKVQGEIATFSYAAQPPGIKDRAGINPAEELVIQVRLDVCTL